MTGSDTTSCEAHRKRVTGGILRSSALISDAIVIEREFGHWYYRITPGCVVDGYSRNLKTWGGV